jgi:hypothetical protein
VSFADAPRVPPPAPIRQRAWNRATCGFSKVLTDARPRPARRRSCPSEPARLPRLCGGSIGRRFSLARAFYSVVSRRVASTLRLRARKQAICGAAASGSPPPGGRNGSRRSRTAVSRPGIAARPAPDRREVVIGVRGRGGPAAGDCGTVQSRQRRKYPGGRTSYPSRNTASS